MHVIIKWSRALFFLSFFVQAFLICCCLATLSNCRPQNDKIDIHDTDDEFVIKKPQNSDPKYTDFLDELYKHDSAKQSASPKSKRDLNTQDDKIMFDDPNLFYDTQPIMEKTVSQLYQSNEFKRSKRMILFRYLSRVSFDNPI